MARAEDHPQAVGRGGKSWKPDHRYILSALGGTLAVAAVVTIISLILSPAQITFYVSHASRKFSPDGGTANLSVTIAAYNPSSRCQARYQSVFVDLKNSSTSAGLFSIHANVPGNVFPMDYTRGPRWTLVNASAVIVKDNEGDYARWQNRINGLTVEVRALVRFKIGVTPTRLYEMKVLCPGVLFHDEKNSTSSTTSAHQASNFTCTG